MYHRKKNMCFDYFSVLKNSKNDKRYTNYCSLARQNSNTKPENIRHTVLIKMCFVWLQHLVIYFMRISSLVKVLQDHLIKRTSLIEVQLKCLQFLINNNACVSFQISMDKSGWHIGLFHKIDILLLVVHMALGQK